MTLAIARSLACGPTLKERSVFIATDSRISFDTGQKVDDGAKVILLDPVPALLAFAGRVDLGERSLALAVKLVQQKSSPNLEDIKEIALTAFKKFYSPGASLWGLLGAVATDGASDMIWKLGPHNGNEMTAIGGDTSAFIGDPQAQAAYERMDEKHWTSLKSMHLGPWDVGIDIAQRHCTILDYTIDEMNQTGKSTIGRPIQALFITKDRWLAFGLGRYNEERHEWEQVHPKSGELRFRHRAIELSSLHPIADELRQRKPD